MTSATFRVAPDPQQAGLNWLGTVTKRFCATKTQSGPLTSVQARQELTAHAAIQNNSGLPQGLPGHAAAA
jgi:hypothetical protein